MAGERGVYPGWNDTAVGHTGPGELLVLQEQKPERAAEYSAVSSGALGGTERITGTIGSADERDREKRV